MTILSRQGYGFGSWSVRKTIYFTYFMCFHLRMHDIFDNEHLIQVHTCAVCLKPLLFSRMWQFSHRNRHDSSSKWRRSGPSPAGCFCAEPLFWYSRHCVCNCVYAFLFVYIFVICIQPCLCPGHVRRLLFFLDFIFHSLISCFVLSCLLFVSSKVLPYFE